MAFTPASGFDDNDGTPEPNRPPWSMGGNIDKLKEPDFGMDGAGNSTLTNLDEREILSDTISATPIQFVSPDQEDEWMGNRVGVYRER